MVSKIWIITTNNPGVFAPLKLNENYQPRVQVNVIVYHFLSIQFAFLIILFLSVDCVSLTHKSFQSRIYRYVNSFRYCTYVTSSHT